MVRAGVEMALIDAVANNIRIPWWRLFGAVSNTVTTDITFQSHEMGVTPAMFEQAVHIDDWEGLGHVSRIAKEKYEVSVAADESCHSVDNAEKIIKENLAHVINIKLAKLGVIGALGIAEMAMELGLWRHYFQNTPGLIFVVDSNDRDRVVEARDKLHRMLNEDKLQDHVLLVFANKQDFSNAMNAAETTDNLGLHSLRQLHWYIQSTCATSGEGLFKGLDWLSNNIVNKARIRIHAYMSACRP